VGACFPDCSPTGADACAGAGRACDPARHSCSPIGCPGGCPTGDTCATNGSYCVPATTTPLYGACTDRGANVSNGCTSELCFTPTGGTGFCGTFCDDSLAGLALCGAGGICWTDNNDDPLAPGDGGLVSGLGGGFQDIGGRALGACVTRCSDSTQCPNGWHCGEFGGGRGCLPYGLPLAPVTPPGTVPAGSVCHADGDCASGFCNIAPGWVEGVCVRAVANSPCPNGTVAFDPTNDSYTCVPTCTGNAFLECPGSLVCDGQAGMCYFDLLCRDEHDCAGGYICDPATSTCVTTPKTGGAATGAACTTDANCAGDFCVQQTTGPVTWTGGYCSPLCEILPDLSDTCPSGTLCAASAVGAIGGCLKLCDADPLISRFGGCRSGYNCVAFTGDPRFGYCYTK
jgi:hypothetical protein